MDTIVVFTGIPYEDLRTLWWTFYFAGLVIICTGLHRAIKYVVNGWKD